jgi:hypothetical protein
LSEVGTWLAAQAARLHRVPSLEDALLGSRPLRYVAYRLRYVYFRALLRCAFRVLEIALFASYFSFEIMGPVLVLRSAMLLADSLYWGALETLRQDVRHWASRAELPRATPAIRAWLAFACVLSMSALGLATLWIVLHPVQATSATDFDLPMFAGIDVIDAFILGCTLRWGLDTFSKTYHSGVYGVRRVYRPLSSLVLADVADFVVFAALFVLLGPWCAGPALLLVGVLRTWLSYRFTHRVYAQLKLTVGDPRHWFRSLFRRRTTRERGPTEHQTVLARSVATALANAVAQVDAWLILGLLSAPASEEGTLLLAALFHVLSPLLSTAQAWARLFYFDFKRLEAWGSPFLLGRFEALLARVAWLSVLPVSALTFALMLAFWRGPALLLALLLSCLSCVRAWLALRHMRAYSLGDHRYLRKLFFGMLLVTASTQALASLPAEQALGALVVLAALGILLLGPSKHSLAAPNEGTLLSPSLWLAQLLSRQEPTALGLVRVDRRLTSLGRVARTMGRHLPEATLGRLGNDALVWFRAKPVSSSRLLTLGAGTLREACQLDNALTGASAVHAGLPSAVWQRHFGQLSQALAEPREASTPKRLLDELERDAKAHNSDLQLLELEGKFDSPLSSPGSNRALRHLILDAARGHTRFERIGDREVLAVAPAGIPMALLVLPSSPRSPAPWKPALMTLVQRTELLLTLRAARLTQPGS